VLKELADLPGGPLGDDPDGWFDRLTGGDSAWERSPTMKGDLREIFDRVAARMKLSEGRVSRADFRAYARQYLAADRSPPWREAREPDWAEEAERLFRRLDRDRDGRLLADELPDGLRADLRRWDADGSQSISPAEYQAYLPDRYRQVARDLGADTPGRPGAGKAVAGVPAWFSTLDADADGQIGLYEWRRAWPAREFVQLDTDRDGFLTADELRRLLAATGPDRLPLVDDLARRRLDRTGDK
jgi:Ca2+-binding EF-hand superfamily protein